MRSEWRSASSTYCSIANAGSTTIASPLLGADQVRGAAEVGVDELAKQHEMILCVNKESLLHDPPQRPYHSASLAFLKR